MDRKPTLLITRPRDAAEALAAALESEGHEVHVAPLTEYVDLPAPAADAGRYQALMFTSAQGVRAFRKREGRLRLPAFCIGAATARAARGAGFADVVGGDGGGGMEAQIRARQESLGLRRMLHVCGADTARDMGAALAGLGIALDRLTLYKAACVGDLPEATARALAEGRIDTVLLFSARAAQHLARLLSRAAFGGVTRRMEAVCISPRVAAALSASAWKAIRVAERPDLASVCAAARGTAPGVTASRVS